jgi:hypothetical protein
VLECEDDRCDPCRETCGTDTPRLHEGGPLKPGERVTTFVYGNDGEQADFVTVPGKDVRTFAVAWGAKFLDETCREPIVQVAPGGDAGMVYR